MAEPEEIDEDLFADLYEADEPAPRQEEPVIQPTPVEPTPPAPVNDEADTQMTTGDGGDADYTAEPPPFHASENGNAYDHGDGMWHVNDVGADNDRDGSVAPEHTGIAIKEDG